MTIELRVTSRAIIRSFLEQMWMRLIPAPRRLHPPTSQLQMKTLVSALIILFLICSPVRSSEREYPDAELLSACIQAVIPEISKRTAQRLGTFVYVAPKGASTLFFARDEQIRGELDGEDWAGLSTSLELLRNRTKAGWSPPESIFVEGLEIAVAERPKDKIRSTPGPLYFEFWPPGYSDDMSTGIVRAAFGPSVHGATATCRLAKHGDSWSVVNKWVTFYA